MPELPEVETTLRGIKPHIIGQKVTDVIIRHPRLRWPIPAELKSDIKNQRLIDLKRRGKYMLFIFKTGTMLLHLGMSGRLCILSQPTEPKKHDHVDLCFTNKLTLRFTDPRRFGALLWTAADPSHHPLLATLGPEPLTSTFTGRTLFEAAEGRKVPVKSFIMNSKIVVGVGNIYATEALFIARIHPNTAAGKISLKQYEQLTTAIKKVLSAAIKQGGTTLRDFMNSKGEPGYFYLKLQAYGRAGKPCLRCHTILKSLRIGQRGTVFCEKCQLKK